jgi:hypothetical protein
MLRLALFLLAAVLPSPARGAIFTVTATGTISSVAPALASEFSVGEEVTLEYEFDSGAPDASANASFGSYPAIVSQDALFGSYATSFQSAGIAGVINVADNGGIGPSGDAYTAYSPSNDPPTGAPVGAFVPAALGLSLSDSSETTFSGDALPTALDLLDFDEASIQLRMNDGMTDAFVQASVESLVFAPEPGEPLLAAVGGAVLAALARLPARSQGRLGCERRAAR